MTKFETADNVTTKGDLAREVVDYAKANPDKWVKVPDSLDVEQFMSGFDLMLRRAGDSRVVYVHGNRMSGRYKVDCRGDGWIQHNPDWDVERWLEAERAYQAKVALKIAEAAAKSAEQSHRVFVPVEKKRRFLR